MRVCETRTINGKTYTTFDYGNAMLVRKARQDYEEDGINKGDVYIEHLINGSRETGERFTITEAEARGFVEVK